MTNDEIDTLLASWKTVNKGLSVLNEEDVKTALNRELVGNRRIDVAMRLHARYSKLRATRERVELTDSLAIVPSFLSGVR